MAQKQSYYESMTREMIKRDEPLRTAQLKFEAASQLRYQLPEPLDRVEWAIPYKSAVPYIALKGGTKALSGLRIRPTIHPVSTQKVKSMDGTAAQVANHWETTLEWELARAMRRAPNFQASVIWNSLVYDEIVAQIIHLPTQIDSIGAFGGKTNRHEAALHFGDFAIRLVDPKTVHSRWSDYMLEAVASVNVQTAQKIVDFWGDKAKKIARKIKDDPKHAFKKYVVVDYWDLESRAVWATEGENEDVVKAGAGVFILKPQKNPFPFIPWAISIGGTNTESAIEHRRKPLLYPLIMAEQWLIANIVGTLGLSQAVAEANAPLHELSGAGAHNIIIDHRRPGGVIYTAQHQTYQRIQRGDIDPGIQTMLLKYESDMNASTLPRVLVTSEAMPGESFSGYNLRVQTAVGALMPYKLTAENFWAQVGRIFLMYCHYSGKPIRGYGVDDESGDMTKYIINPEEINPNVIELSIELSPDVPIDRGQKINNAVAMAERLNYSPIKILEFMGETDPHGAIEEWIQWMFSKAKIEGRVQRIQMEESGEIDRIIQEGIQMQLEARCS
jgi:hypothetical protein